MPAASPIPYLALRRKSGTPVWVSIGWRVLTVLVLLGIAIGVHWLDRAGLKDNHDGEISFVDVVYFTMISITTTGYGDIAPVTERARLFDALVVTPIRVFVILLFLGTTYHFVIRRVWDRWVMAGIQRTLKNHVVIVGYGRSGSRAAQELIARGTKPDDIVAIDRAPEALAAAESCGVNVLQGDATRDETLAAAKVGDAQSVVVSAGRDDTSILITLTARHLSPKARISVTVEAEDNELLARQAGADTVINPTSFAGLLLAGACQGRHVTDYFSDLASMGGRVTLVERGVRPDEVGKPLARIASGYGVRVYRGDRAILPDDPAAAALQDGDVIIEIVDR